MKLRNWAYIAASAAIGLTIAGCGDGGKGADNAGGGDPNAKTISVESFKGGYGIDFFVDSAHEYEAKHPGVHINVSGDPRIWEKLRPEFAEGKPPAITWPGWDMDYWALINGDQVLPLDDALAKPAYGQTTGTWKDTFEPSMLKLGQYNGKQYELPFHFNVLGWWYNPDVFAKHGWTPPKTFAELLALCPKIKAAGMAPITYTGMYPAYTIQGFLFPWALSVGGEQVIDDAQSLKKGAWKDPAFLKAAQMIKQLADAGFFEDGVGGLSHTQSQMDFLQGKAAMIPCGTWLYSEMSKTMPAGAKMAFMNPPVVDGGKGDPSAIQIGIEPWIVPSQGANHDLAIDYYKYMTSLDKAKEFVQKYGTLMAIKGSDQVQLPDHLKQPAAMFKSSKQVYAIEFDQWYAKLGKEVKDAMTALLNGTNTPEQFCQRCEDEAEKLRQDPDTKIHTMTPLSQ